MNIGNSVKSIRKQMGFNQQELSAKAGITQTALSQIENGLKAPNTKTVERICTALNIPVSLIYVLAMEESDVPENKKEDYKRIFPYIKNMVLEITTS